MRKLSYQPQENDTGSHFQYSQSRKTSYDLSTTFHSKQNLFQKNPPPTEQIDYINKCISQDKFDDALSAINACINNQSSKDQTLLGVDLLEKAGEICFLKGEFDGSLFYFNTALEISTKSFKEDSSELADLFFYIGRALLENRQDATALVNLKKSIKMSIKSLEQSSTSLSCVANIVKLKRIQGKLTSANKHLRKWSEELFTQNNIQGSLGLADYYEQVGLLESQKKDFSKAIQYLEKAFKIRSNFYEQDSVYLAPTYLSFGEFYLLSKQSEKAHESFNKALVIYKERFGGLHYQVAVCYEKIGLVYQEEKNFELAFSNIKKAFEIKLEIYEADHPQVGETHYNLGVLYEVNGYPEEALASFERALEIYQTRFGEDSISAACCYQSIGTLLSSENTEKAKGYFEKAIEIRMKCGEDESVDAARCYHNLGQIYIQQEKGKKALENLRKAAGIYEKYTDHPDLGLCYLNISGILEERGIYAESLENYQKALEAFVRSLGMLHPLVAETINRIGALKFWTGAYLEAVENYEKALEIAYKIYGQNNYVLAMYYNNLSMAHGHLKNHRLSIDYVRKSLKIYEDKPETRSQDMSKAYLTLASIMDELNRRRESMGFYQKAMVVQRKGNKYRENDAIEDLIRAEKLSLMMDWEVFFVEQVLNTVGKRKNM